LLHNHWRIQIFVGTNICLKLLEDGASMDMAVIFQQGKLLLLCKVKRLNVTGW